MVELLALIYTTAALVGLWWLRKESKRIAEGVVTDETRWMVDEMERLDRRIDKMTDEPSIKRLTMRNRKMFKEL